MMTLFKRPCPLVRHGLFWIMLLGFLLRLGSWSVNYPMMRWQNDARMSIPAVRLLDGKGLSLQDDAGPTAYRPPLYIAWLAGSYALFGKFAVAGPSFLQILVSTGNIALLYFLAKQIWKRTDIALASAGLLAIHPYVVYHDPALYHTFFTTALLLGGMLCLTKGVETKRGILFVISGLLFGACILIMSTIVPFLIALVGAGLFVWRMSLRLRVRSVAFFILGLSLSWGPWIVRNALVFHDFIPLTTESGVTLWMGNNPESSWRLPLREHEAASVPEGTHFNIPYYYAGCKPLSWCRGGVSESQENKELTQLATSWIKEHPTTFLRLTLWRMANIWSPFLTPAKTIGQPVIAWLITYGYAAWNFLLIILTLLGFFLAWRTSSARLYVILAPFLAITGTGGYALFLYFTKYRIPFEMLLLPFAGAALVHLLQKTRLSRSLMKIA